MSTPVRPPVIANVNGISGTTLNILIAGNDDGGGDQSIAVIFHFVIRLRYTYECGTENLFQ